MDRRNFIKRTSIVGGVAMASFPHLFNSADSKYKMGYQLYSIRDRMAERPIDTLKALKAVGYEDFEVYGYDDTKNLIYGFSPSEFKSILDDLGLSVTSGHYGFSPYLKKSDDAIKGFVDRCIVAAKKMDSKYITWPWLDPDYRNMEDFKLMAEKLNIIGEQVTKTGLGFAYHNHGFEFEDYDGDNGYEVIIRDTDPELVKLQMDMYWVMHSSKTTPKELVNRQPGRIVMWHIKDMDTVNRDYTELGNGSINYLKVLPDPKQSGLEYYYLEQGGNFAVNSMRSAQQSGAYCKNHLRQFL